jgi:hypothetical protein
MKNMKYFLDTEFIEGFHKPTFGKRRHFIDLISIGIYREDGKSLHLISNEYDYNDASDWVKKNVIEKLYIHTVHGDIRNSLDTHNFHKHFGISNNDIAQQILEFFECGYEDGNWHAPQGIEVYAYYGDYDWVLFCSLFGTMMDLPNGFPMYCRDLKQMMDDANLNSDWKKNECPDPEGEHNALVDAKWNYRLFNAIEKQKADFAEA